jgi:hypothetical protein
MSKAILEYNLSNSDDLASYTRAVNADKMASALFEIQYNMLKKVRYIIESKEVDSHDALDLVADEMENILNECYLNVEEITQ